MLAGAIGSSSATGRSKLISCISPNGWSGASRACCRGSTSRSHAIRQKNSTERAKRESHYRRGTLRESLADSVTGAIAEPDTLFTKFFGIYQQDDRDLRDERRRAKQEPLYRFMVRVRLPGGVCTSKQWLA